MVRVSLVVALVALVAACGGADDSAFGGDAADAGAAIHYGPHGLPDCEVTCGDDHQAVCPAPGKTKADLDGMYTVTVHCTPCGDYGAKVRESVAEDGRSVVYCETPGYAVTFKSR